MATPNLYAWNDFSLLVTLYADVAGVQTPLSGASCTAFLSVDANTTTAKASGAPSGTVTEIGSTGQYDVVFQGSDMTDTIMDALATTDLYVHVRAGSDVRIAIKCKYVKNRVVAVA